MEVVIGTTVFAVALGLVAYAAVPPLRKKNSMPACMSNLKRLGQAYSLYHEDCGEWPRFGLVSWPYRTKPYGLRKDDVRCPLAGWQYRDTYARGNARKTRPPTSKFFPDGSRIPAFDPETDVLVRCLDHGFDGFDKGSSQIWSISKDVRGRVLGVRANGSVAKVSPMSCFEMSRFTKWDFRLYPRLWKGCDNPSRP